MEAKSLIKVLQNHYKSLTKVLVVFERRCKDTSKVNNVFLCGWKFYQKIVFFSSFRLLVEPSEAVEHADCGDVVLLRDRFSRVFRGQPFVPGDEIGVHDGLVLRLDRVPGLGHIGVVGITNEVGYVV